MKFQFKYMLMAAFAAVLSVGAVSCNEDSVEDIAGIYEAPTVLKVTGATLAEKTKEGNIRTFILTMNNSNNIDMKLAIVSNKYYVESGNYMPAPLSNIKNGTIASELSSINGSAVVEGTLALAQNGDNFTIKNSVLFTADGKAYKFDGEFVLACEPDDPTALNQIKMQYDWSGNANEYADNGDGTYTIIFTTGGYEQGQNADYTTSYKGEGYDFQIQFILPDGKLHPGTYGPGTGYVIGAKSDWEAYGVFTGTSWGSIANGTKTMTYITSGDIVVTKNGSKYSVFIDQGKGGVYAEFKGAIPSLDPDGGEGGSDAVELAFGGGISWVQYGGSTIALSFAAPGASIEYNATFWSFVASGTGVAFNVEFFSTDGTLAPGTYTPADNGSVAEGNWLKGYDNNYGGFGGSVLHNVSGDADSASALTEGTFEVTKDGENYTIKTTIDGVDYMYNGPITL